MSKKILLIEDEYDLADNICKILELSGFSVSHAENGKEGLAAAEKELPDLIISDIMMPGLDGFKLKEKLNLNGKTSLIPFIFLTAKVEYSDLRKGMSLGADDYIFKPFQASDLIKTINIRLNKVDQFRARINNEEIDIPENGKLNIDDNLMFRINNESSFVRLERIRFIEAQRQLYSVVLKNQKTIILRKTLNYWEKILPENYFIRIHRSTIVNVNEIDKVKNINSGRAKVLLSSPLVELDVSRRYSSKIRDQFLT